MSKLPSNQTVEGIVQSIYSSKHSNSNTCCLSAQNHDQKSRSDISLFFFPLGHESHDGHETLDDKEWIRSVMLGAGRRNLAQRASARERGAQGQKLGGFNEKVDCTERFQEAKEDDEEDQGRDDGMIDFQPLFFCPWASFLMASTIRSNWRSRLSSARF